MQQRQNTNLKEKFPQQGDKVVVTFLVNGKKVIYFGTFCYMDNISCVIYDSDKGYSMISRDRIVSITSENNFSDDDGVQHD